MRRPIWILSLAAAVTLAAGAAWAAGISVEVNQTRRVTLSGAAANVVVANPAIADVMMTDSHSVVIVGKGPGVTGILITDRTGHALLNERVAVVGPDMDHVTVFRGATATEYSCAGRCISTTAADAAAAQASTAAATATNAANSQPINHP